MRHSVSPKLVLAGLPRYTPRMSDETIPENPSDERARGGWEPAWRLRRFWMSISDGMRAEELWRQFHSEARAGIDLYRREVAREMRKDDEGPMHGMRMAG